MIGMTNEFNPRFLRRYLNLFDDITKAVGHYITDVKSKNFLTKMSNTNARNIV